MPAEDASLPRRENYVPSGQMNIRVDTVVNDYYTRWKWAPFQVRTNLESLSLPLQQGLRFLHHPLPALPTDLLADHLPFPDFGKRREIGLTVFPAMPT